VTLGDRNGRVEEIKQKAAAIMHQPRPERITGSQLSDFMGFCAARTGRIFSDDQAFSEDSISNYRSFWKCFLDWSSIIAEGTAHPICDGDTCETAQFFPGLRLNYVENLLRIDTAADRDRPAIIAQGRNGGISRYTRGELRAAVIRGSKALAAIGVKEGDRVVAVVNNDAEAVIGALSVLALGATFSSASPDMGAPAILNRFTQLSPSILMTSVTADATRDILAGLPTLRSVVILGKVDALPALGLPMYALPAMAVSPEGRDDEMVPDHDWPRFPFNHPLFIMFSSGTTGRPKCIVHGAGGTLMEHLKEHRLHGDLRPTDVMFFNTSTAWMMWNWQLSALACKAAIVLFQGSVSGPETLWDVVSRHDVTVFGTSPPYLRLCRDAHYTPAPHPALRAVMSTGSILYPPEYDWLKEHVGDVPLQSISGGTDIIGCFVLGHPHLPVYRGESQSRSLAMDTQIVRAPGVYARVGTGDLVCCNPFPSRPIGFYNDEDGSGFHKAYFSQNGGVWTHGDLVRFTQAGTAEMLGRSDSVLNINGHRVGPGEIAQILTAVPEVLECMAVEQTTPEGPDSSRMVLLVVPHEPGSITEQVRSRIRSELSQQASAAYVPSVIVEVDSVPTTFSGKRSERAARDALNGLSVNTEAIKNPESLALIRSRLESEDIRQALEPSTGEDAGALDDIETTVSRTWRKVLHCRPGPGDRWDLSGGDSLKMLRFVFELEEAIGCELPLDRLRMNMTASDFAKALRRVLAHSVADEEADEGKPTIVLFPGRSGDSPSLASFRAELRDVAQFLVIKYPDWTGMIDHRERVEDLASVAIEQIEKALPSGDLMFAGYSLGGGVGFVTASRLAEKGRNLRFFAVLDTNVSAAGMIPRKRKSPLRKSIDVASERFLGVQRDNGVWERANAYVLTRLALKAAHTRYRPVLRWLKRRDLSWLPDLTRYEMQKQLTEALQRQAFRNWIRESNKTALPQKVVLFHSQAKRNNAPPDLGWGRLFSTVEVIQVSGDHIEMLRVPHRATMCSRFAQALAAAKERQASVS
jgi:acetoacetyl-CoA synthetase